EVVLVAYGTAARVARTAVERAREQGLRAGLFRPITLWPFPADGLREVARGARAVLVVEMSSGQMVEDVRLTLDGSVPVLLHARMGGSIPTPDEVVAAARQSLTVTAPGGPVRVVRTSAGVGR
ncbi:MAG TPA: transketolase C-terminal domain-containing protein, partial [Candidatus Limnocylindrales bacterium]|nr:transketolase C-terminal domain-containing protein [Candidatus Limnocylindrales bacterium]